MSKCDGLTYFNVLLPFNVLAISYKKCIPFYLASDQFTKKYAIQEQLSLSVQMYHGVGLEKGVISSYGNLTCIYMSSKSLKPCLTFLDLEKAVIFHTAILNGSTFLQKV